MSDVTDLFAAAQRLQQQGLAYALVSVVRTQAPTSARTGDKALVTSEGILHGWIGGGCAQPAVLQTVRQALQDGNADAALAASVFHYGTFTVGEVKPYLADRGVAIRPWQRS